MRIQQQVCAVLGALAIACGLVACGSEGPGETTMTPVVTPVGGAGGAAGSVPLAGAPPTTAGMGAAGSGGSIPIQPGTAGQPGHMPGDVPQPSGTGAALPCEVSRVLAANCQNCHGATPQFGAPMPLMTYDDMAKASPKNASVKTSAAALARLNDQANPMPPGGTMPAMDRAVLVDWLTNGAAPAPATEGECSQGPMQPRDISYWKNGLTPLPGETCHELPVHAGQSGPDGQPYMVRTGEHYEQFYHKVPWGPDQVMTRFGSKFDNLTVVHHWLLFTSSKPASQIGTHETTVGSTIGDQSQLIAGWAVGGDHVTFPADTALELTPNGILNAQWHYSNPGSSAVPDKSLIQVCTVPRSMKANVGSLTFLGTENFNGPLGMPPKTMSSFGGSCLNDSGGPITIFGFNPHMHRLGRHMNTVIQRLDGKMETVFDKAFDFNSQITYVLNKPIVLNAGETIISTCTFDNHTDASVPFGPSTEQEMCYNFTMSYPAKAMDNGAASLIGATNVCW